MEGQRRARERSSGSFKSDFSCDSEMYDDCASGLKRQSRVVDLRKQDYSHSRERANQLRERQRESSYPSTSSMSVSLGREPAN